MKLHREAKGSEGKKNLKNDNFSHKFIKRCEKIFDLCFCAIQVLSLIEKKTKFKNKKGKVVINISTNKNTFFS